ncbi:MAG: DUF721 domain-containing protein [Sedimentisphaerales bacterium]|nr:DUF721 domain-containing protein [Sedimentisphaerales bacterium]
MADFSDATLRRLWQLRQRKRGPVPLAGWVDRFMRREVVARQKRLGRLGRAWQEILPAELVRHSCLEGLRGGTLRVLVDNSSSLYELNQSKESLLAQLRQSCPADAPAAIRFVRGQWYRTNDEGVDIPTFPAPQRKQNERDPNEPDI